jgi:hypothetical protein
MRSAANIQRRNDNTKRLTFTIVHHMKNLVNMGMSIFFPFDLSAVRRSLTLGHQVAEFHAVGTAA